MPQPQTDRLALPLLGPGQAQKEITHNEALLRLDMLCQTVVTSADMATPPATPSDGECWIIAAAPSGDWATRSGAIAGWTANGWRFVSPGAGWRVWVTDRSRMMRFDGSAWQDEAVGSDGYFVAGQRVLSGRQGAIASPASGAVVDVEGRSAINAILAALRAHGLIAP